MLSSIRLTDEDLLLRPFRLDDAPQLNCAVRESLEGSETLDVVGNR